MGSTATKQEAKKVDEAVVENGGLHLFEMHLPSASIGFIFTIVIIIAIVLLIYFGCRHFAKSRRRQQQQPQSYAMQPLPPLPLPYDNRFFSPPSCRQFAIEDTYSPSSRFEPAYQEVDETVGNTLPTVKQTGTLRKYEKRVSQQEKDISGDHTQHF